MYNTGRIKAPIRKGLRKIVFGETIGGDALPELRALAMIDEAHVVMLAEQAILPHSLAAAFLKEVRILERSAFRPLMGVDPLRGLYLAYEAHLAQAMGSAFAGNNHSGRSRNDIGATTLRLRLRSPYAFLISKMLSLKRVMLTLASQHSQLLMPIHTNWQPAFPSTYGHYLAGVAFALTRDVRRLLGVANDLQYSPLGASAGGGTSFPIKPARTAALLGFETSVLNSLDAVASRDIVLELLAGLANLGVTLGRVAQDFLLFLTPEYGFFSLPDELVGSSSVLPQKRNPFLLEHVQGKSAEPLGSFVACATAQHSKPFTNLVSVNGESVRSLWKSLEAMLESITLLSAVLRQATPCEAHLQEAVGRNFLIAPALAERIALDTDLPFRAAHSMVGNLVRDSEASGSPLEREEPQDSEARLLQTCLQGLNAAAAVKAFQYGGGPGGASIAFQLDCLWKTQREQQSRLSNLRKTWRDARLERRGAVDGLLQEHSG